MQRFEVHTALLINIFLDIMPYQLVNTYWCSGGQKCLWKSNWLPVNMVQHPRKLKSLRT